jgi:hypothetical protein
LLTVPDRPFPFPVLLASMTIGWMASGLIASCTGPGPALRCGIAMVRLPMETCASSPLTAIICASTILASPIKSATNVSAGRSYSSRGVPSWAILALLCTEERDSSFARRGIEYLISSQNDNGTWDEEEFTGTGFPKVFYLRYHMYRSYFPLLALSKYRSMVV